MDLYFRFLMCFLTASLIHKQLILEAHRRILPAVAKKIMSRDKTEGNNKTKLVAISNSTSIACIHVKNLGLRNLLTYVIGGSKQVCKGWGGRGWELDNVYLVTNMFHRGPYKPPSRSIWTHRVQLLPNGGTYQNF